MIFQNQHENADYYHIYLVFLNKLCVKTDELNLSSRALRELHKNGIKISLEIFFFMCMALMCALNYNSAAECV